MLPLAEIDQLMPKKGRIIDLGCGEGVAAKYLARTITRQLIAVDNNKKRLQKSLQNNLDFVLADIRSYDFKKPDAILISDVLHHLNYQDQKTLLSKIVHSLRKGGIFIVKEIDTDEFIRSRLTRLWDFLLYPQDKIYYHKAKDLKKHLESLGFKVSVRRASRLFPGSTNLFICQKS